MAWQTDAVLQFTRHGLDIVKSSYPARWTPPVPSEARWSAERARRWEEETGWLVGCNFTPSTAGNQLEVFQDETYDPETIDRELGWAADLGMNSIRLFTHHLLHELPYFHDRLDEILGIASSHGIGAVLVPFDGCWRNTAKLGPQGDPVPGLHNSMWLQSPGKEILSDPRRWHELRPYLDALLERFGDDTRVQAWDLYNEPNGPEADIRTGAPQKYRLPTELLSHVFDWAQAADPSQPLTAGVFIGMSGAAERGDPINRVMLGRSDIISFHSYKPKPKLEACIEHLAAYRRPMVCTEWMGRPQSPVELIDVFAAHGVGCHTWGLVDGRTQTRYPWSSAWRRSTPDTPWFHELLHPDGSPYDPAEVAHLRRVVLPRTRPAP